MLLPLDGFGSGGMIVDEIEMDDPIVDQLMIAMDAMVAGQEVFGHRNPTLDEWEALVKEWIRLMVFDSGDPVERLAGIDFGITSWKTTHGYDWSLTEDGSSGEIREMALARKVARTPIAFLMGLPIEVLPASLQAFYKPLLSWQRVYRDAYSLETRVERLRGLRLPLAVELIDSNYLDRVND